VRLREAADAAKRPAEIEVYPAQHGWCTIDAPIYDKAQAEKAWARMLALYKQYSERVCRAEMLRRLAQHFRIFLDHLAG
jgi:dienelactone hydrolase